MGKKKKIQKVALVAGYKAADLYTREKLIGAGLVPMEEKSYVFKGGVIPKGEFFVDEKHKIIRIFQPKFRLGMQIPDEIRNRL